MKGYYIGLDVHCAFTEMAVVTSGGRLVQRWRGDTTIPSLVEALDKVRRPRRVALEEGPMADWLARNLRKHADELVVCNPRRNHLIAKDSDKDDPLDAEKLAQLYRGGYLKLVYHPESLERSILKQHVGLYHDRVRQRVAEANRIIALFRTHGVFVQESDFANPDDRPELMPRLPRSDRLHEDVNLLWSGYDAVADQVDCLRRSVHRLAAEYETIRRFVCLPGMGPVRAATFYVYVDTPWRFRKREALWKYVGIGLEHSGSGESRPRVRVVRWANRRLKYAMLGAAMTAIRQKANPFAAHYQRWIEEGISPQNARRNVARHQTATMWGMWKNGSEYRPEWVARGEGVVVPSLSR